MVIKEEMGRRKGMKGRRRIICGDYRVIDL
jgi:hypothetical protein